MLPRPFQEIRKVQKLLIIPGMCQSLGGTLVTLHLLLQGLEQCSPSQPVCVLVWSGSLMETYLQAAQQGRYLKSIPASTQAEFLQKALDWVHHQPKDWPLLLDNCVERSLLPTLAKSSLSLRLSHRPVFHFFHDLALSYNALGYLARKVIFRILSPGALCNSHFTAQHITPLVNRLQGILYQPVDLDRFRPRSPVDIPPANLRPLLSPETRLLLVPTRIRMGNVVNDKNLQSLIPLVAALNASGEHYHAVMIGEDRSPHQVYTQTLLAHAAQAGMGDFFTILPPSFEIEQYYKFADVVVTLAPREPFGRTVIEAVACGIPVIGSNTGGISEILSHFAPEWRVNPNDLMAAAATLRHAMSDQHTAQRLIQGRSWIEAHCSPQEYAYQIMRITGLAQWTQDSLTSTQKEVSSLLR
jgi:glycosyltransferase involved in cell wall biosynthesis